jgi:hypothetical protein
VNCYKVDALARKKSGPWSRKTAQAIAVGHAGRTLNRVNAGSKGIQSYAGFRDMTDEVKEKLRPG